MDTFATGDFVPEARKNKGIKPSWEISPQHSSEHTPRIRRI